ncbi:MAG: 30S ribosomal protein S21 [Candidatus Marinimicrobia bacterium]|nr:30S ribosomal protein S21 [Candidatus Neomarinimicrobiota bacterium]
MISIKIKDGEPFEKALRRFKKKWEKAGVLREIRSRSYYLKPSEKKKIEFSKRFKRAKLRNYSK